MKEQQLKRWKKLSIGLAKHGWPEMTRARRKKVADEVAAFIEYMSEFHLLKDISDWDGNAGSVYVGDEMKEYLDDHYHYNSRTDCEKGNKFANQVSSCIRAGFDVAVEPSLGVLGFTVGNLKAIFKNRIPSWAAGFFEPPLTATVPNDEALWM